MTAPGGSHREAAPTPARDGTRGSDPCARRPSPAEVGLLDLAQSLAATATARGEAGALAGALALLDSAFDPDSSLPRQLSLAWLRTRGDKTAALALGWAREQVRRALAEVVDGARRGRGSEPGMSADAAAWLLLAAAEGESHEVGGTVSERLRTVCSLLGLS